MLQHWTMGDLCALTGYTRDQVRGLLDALPPRGERDGRRRAATSYSMQDLVFVALCCRLEQPYGLKREKVAELSTHISAQLAEPRERGVERLLVRFDVPSVELVSGVDALTDGLVISMDPVFDQVNDYLLPGGGARSALIGAPHVDAALRTRTRRATNGRKD